MNDIVRIITNISTTRVTSRVLTMLLRTLRNIGDGAGFNGSGEIDGSEVGEFMTLYSG